MPPADPGAPAGPTRRDPSWLWILAGALLVARVATGLYEAQHPPERPDLMSWVPAEQAAARARATGRPILYDFSAAWCGPCRRMHDEVFADEKQANAVGRLVVPVQVVDRRQEDGHNPAIVDSLQRAHAVESFPTLVIVDADGRALDRMEGFEGATKLLSWLGRSSLKARLNTRPGASFTFP